MKIAVCQIQTELDMDLMLPKAERYVAEAAANGADVVVLPEMYNCPYAKKFFKLAAERGHQEACSAMSRWARENRIILVGGSIPEAEGDKLYNTSFVFDQQGQQIARHRKVHLFDIALPNMHFKESDTFTPGEEITVFDTCFGKMGVAVCFDIRFPELFRAMARRGAQVIFLPAQFNMSTGPVHWEMQLRCRAVDNEVFLVGASAARNEEFSYHCWGHSMIVDPFGIVLSGCDEKEQILYADIDLSKVDEVRQQLPTFLHLRTDLYTVAE